MNKFKYFFVAYWKNTGKHRRFVRGYISGRYGTGNMKSCLARTELKLFNQNHHNRNVLMSDIHSL